MSEQPERRRDRRIPVELWIEAEAGDELYFHRAANLSAGGAYFDRTIPEPVGKVVQLRFTLPGAPREIACRGEIVSAQGLGMGVRFVDLAEDDRVALESLLERLDQQG